ncbi:MAG TPA: four-carbon acid sugar kinase family protein [Chthoniobacterales bacterium]|nr:four-carbon acid sugar kinase family protein [Chthoniobacterales bacterium]
MKPHLVILADDLTGAADCAVPFVRSGFPSEVFLQPQLVKETEAPVVSVDLNTRGLTPGQAVQVASRAFTLIPSTTSTVWYRKIDSTLRGNIGPDVLASLRRLGGKRTIFCAPAFPDTGRTTVNGKVLVNGLPLENSGVHQRSSKSLVELFAEVGLPTKLIPLEVIRGGPANLLNHLKSHSRVTAVILDAETNDDLLVIAQTGLQIRQEVIFVGSAGLTHQIAAVWGSESLQPRGHDLASEQQPKQNYNNPMLRYSEHDLLDKSKTGKGLRLPHKPILIVVGSKSAISRAQCNEVADKGEVDVLRATVAALESGDGSIADAVTGALVNGRDLVITTELPGPISETKAGHQTAARPDEGRNQIRSNGANGIGIASEANSAGSEGVILMRNLGAMLRPFLGQFSALVLTGGETGRGILTQSGIGRLRMVDEIEPGVTLSVSLGKPEIPIVMKAGAFGSPATLLNALHFLRSHKR